MTICFRIDLVRVLATTGDTSASIRVYNYTKIQGPRFERNYMINKNRRKAIFNWAAKGLFFPRGGGGYH